MAKGFEIHHIWQPRKKRVGPFGSIITTLFGSTNYYKYDHELEQRFLENLMLYICIGYMPFSICENVLLSLAPMSPLCFSISFISCGKNVTWNVPKTHGLACVAWA
jgi:hypothetical protein